MFTITVARPEEWPEAFQLVFAHLDEATRATRVANAQRLAAVGDLDAAGILVARADDRLCGAVVCAPLAGAGGILWPPNTTPGAAADVAEQLVQRALSWLRRKGSKVVQALLAPSERSLAAPLERVGFRHITSLQYLRHDLDNVAAPLQLPPHTSVECYTDTNAAVFHETLLRTYQHTQDCPELNGVRTIDEIIAGHKAQGEFDAGRWWLATTLQRPAGVLLVTKTFDEPAWDLSYVGVIPEARRQGLGRALTQLALREARAAEVSQLTLAVDARNIAAARLYENLGFHATQMRDVFLALLTAP
jgi:mycothiol synthase